MSGVNVKACESTKLAKELMELIGDQPTDALGKLANLIALQIGKQSGPKKKEIKYSDPKKPKAFNDIQAREFERQPIPFGKFKDAYVGQVDSDYLEWLAEGDQFIRDLRRYIASKRYKNRQDK